MADAANRLRYAAICLLEFLDARVLRHRLYGFCVGVTCHPWSSALCGNGCKLDAEGFCDWCGWGQPLEVDRG